MAKIVFINPKFESSYWGMEYALPIFAKKCNMPTSALPLLAALTPAGHEVKIIDENVEEIDFVALEKADIVGVTGMIVQRHQMQKILVELKKRKIYTVLGGPWVTVQEDAFLGLTKTRFIGEAEITWPEFLLDWENDQVKARYEQKQKTDMSTLPKPRLDLLKIKKYLFGSIQFTRGCPFNCEFCDIIVTFGRKTRAKTPDQIIAELENLKRTGFIQVFIVDDNFIGNKTMIEPILDRVIQWQKDNGYPFAFFTEASINLAEDKNLLDKMILANIQCVFIGIESPDEASLKETKKTQNIRGEGSLLDRVKRIQKAGIEVWCGMIVGFDNDDSTVFKLQKDFITSSRISQAMVGMLTAIPKTPLYERLKNADRLNDLEKDDLGTNIIPLKISPEELKAGYLKLSEELYTPENYFKRVDALYCDPDFYFDKGKRLYLKNHLCKKLWGQAVELLLGLIILIRLTYKVKNKSLRQIYYRKGFSYLRKRKDPNLFLVYVIKIVVHYHYHIVLKRMKEGKIVNSF